MEKSNTDQQDSHDPLMNNFLNTPRCDPEDLGKPIPESRHAVSVCLPLWEQNVGYEAADPQVIQKLQCGYPRFFVHPLAARLFAECEARFASNDECCFAFPSQRVAEHCVDYISHQTGQISSVHEWGSLGIFAVCLPKAARDAAMSYWQHTGEIVSSRAAEAAVKSTASQSTAAYAAATVEKQTLRERIATATQSSPDDVFLYPSGMAAIFSAFRAFQGLRPQRRSVQFGFPYVDTLKILQRFSGVQLFRNGDQMELDKLERLLQAEEIMGLFCEFPGNPLLRSPNLARLSHLAKAHGFPMLVDDTLGGFFNIHAMPGADALATSLTKFFSGQGDVMGGSLVLNPYKPFYDQLKSVLLAEYEDLLFPEDARVLERNSRNFCQRVRRINQTTEQLCDFLRQHPAVERVDYPKYHTTENYRAFLKPDGGYGGLFSMLLREPARNAPAFFDALRISKGPNLGTNFSLCCPYTILAHYNELDFAESCDVSRYLLRVSIGLEEPNWLIGRFTEALDRMASFRRQS